MHYKRLKLVTLFLLGVCLAGLQAQKAIPAAGGNATGSGGSVSYTIGQVDYNSSLSRLVNPGVQQPYLIAVKSISAIPASIELFFNAFPNPVSDFLTLKIDTPENSFFSSLTYRLTDMNGKLLEKKRIEGNETIIPTGNLKPASYILQVSDTRKELKSFIIIKK